MAYGYDGLQHMFISAAFSLTSQFTGKERDTETGLDFFLARYYSSAQGRFISPDRKISPDAVYDSQSWNKYVYVRNNPIRLVDPNGEDWMDLINGVANAVNSNFTFGIGRETGNDDFKAGQVIGDLTSTAAGLIEMEVGGAIAGGGAILTPPSGGAGLIAVGGGIIIAGHGAIESMISASNAIQGITTMIRGVTNPDGARGKPDHQEEIKKQADQARSEASPGETVLEGKKVQGADSNRRPDVQVVGEDGKVKKVIEVERKPDSKRNIDREKEYKRLNIPSNTVPLPPGQ
jgi:RHS repeat-associated protein